MVILHVAGVYDNPSSGICEVIPKHIINQQSAADVILLNICDYSVPGIKNQLRFDRNWKKNLVRSYGKPDLIVFHQTYHIENIIVSLWARANRIPYILVPHGDLTRYAQSIKKTKKTIGNAFAFGSFIRSAVKLQYLSNSESENSAFDMPFYILPNGFDIPSCKKSSFRDTGKVFIYIGRLDIKIKGLDLLTDAVYQKRDILRDHCARFLLYGPDIDNSRDILEQKINMLSIGDLITVNKPVYGDQKARALLSSDYFIQCSRSEGMPMGILEALAYGLPCLVTKGTSMCGIINKYNAGRTAENDTGSIAEMICSAVCDSEYTKTQSENAVKLIEDNFTWEKVAASAVSEYKKAIGENS